MKQGKHHLYDEIEKERKNALESTNKFRDEDFI
jgi:hypothetical protein